MNKCLDKYYHHPKENKILLMYVTDKEKLSSRKEIRTF